MRARALAFAGLVALAAACSTSSAEVDGGAPLSMDAASGPQPVGRPCDPSLATPCLATGEDCLTVVCDPTTLVCTESLADAGPTCNGGTATCMKSSDCDTGLTCGFPIGGGCGAAGVCLNVPVLCEDDAAACVLPGTTCGCGAVPVAVVLQGFAAGPTPSPSPGVCSADAGAPVDAGAPGDAGGDP